MRPQPKLTLDQVIEIAAEFLSGAVSIKALARKYGVACSTVHRALAGEKMYAEYQRHLPVRRIRAMLAYKASTKGTRLSVTDVLDIRRLFAGGVDYRELSRRFGVTPQSIACVVRGETHRLVGGPRYRAGERLLQEGAE